MFPAILVTGETYKHRHDLRRIGGRFDHSEGGYVFPAGSLPGIAEFIADKPTLTTQDIELAYDPLEPETPGQIRDRRNAARDRKADRLERQAANRERDANRALARHQPYTSDYAFITEPIKIGHHSERRHRKLRQKIARAMDEEMSNRIEAQRLRERAAYLRNTDATVKGDAAARRQQERDANDALIQVGSVVHSIVYGRNGTVVRVNRNSYTVRFENGWTDALDKSHVRFVSAGTPEKPARPFKRGDRVTFKRLMWKGEGVVQRVNPSTCTVRITFNGRERLEKFSDSELTPAPIGGENG